MPARRRPTAKQRAAQKAWKQRQEARDAFVRGDPSSGAVPLEGETSWSLAGRPKQDVVADMIGVRGVRFPAGHVFPPAADPHYRPYVIINRRDGINCVLTLEGGSASTSSDLGS